jgi:hypothetical protein
MSENEGDCETGVVAGPWMWTAYRAYNELLRDKLKKKFEAQEGPWMDNVADVLAQIVKARWESGRQQDQHEKQGDELFERLEKLLSE